MTAEELVQTMTVCIMNKKETVKSFYLFFYFGKWGRKRRKEERTKPIIHVVYVQIPVVATNDEFFIYLCSGFFFHFLLLNLTPTLLSSATSSIIRRNSTHV